MANNITTAPAGATLTQKELFQRFLDAPYYESVGFSALKDTRRVGDMTVQDKFLICAGLASGHWPELGYGWGGLHDFLLEHLRESDEPEYDLDEIVEDLSMIQRDFEWLKSGFEGLATVTRTAEPDEEALDSEAFDVAIRGWEEEPRYVLPETAVAREVA